MSGKSFEGIIETLKAGETVEYLKLFVSAISEEKFNIWTFVNREGTKYCQIYNVLASSVDILKKGYKIANIVYRKVTNAKSKGRKLMEVRLKITRDVDVVITKKFKVTSDISLDTITPNRFCMILTLAAYKIWDKAIIDKDTNTMIRLYREIKNPFGTFLGFYPPSEPKTCDDSHAKMLGYYLSTTIGFDALVHVNPTMATTVAMYRSLGDHPKKLGLLNNLKGSDNPCNNGDLLVRCFQGVYTKTFVFENQTVKLEDVMNNIGFVKCIKNEISWLKYNARILGRTKIKTANNKLLN